MIHDAPTSHLTLVLFELYGLATNLREATVPPSIPIVESVATQFTTATKHKHNMA